MNIAEYSNEIKTPYHFESSDRYCDILKIQKAEYNVQNKLNMNQSDVEQLKAIVEIEKLRYNLAHKNIEIEKYKKNINTISDDFYRKYDINIFSNTKVHDEFYYYLNKEYL